MLYLHFQRSVVPGWLDKHLCWRHRATPFLDNLLVLAPNPEWVKTLPNGKLPDRTDFTHFGADLVARVKVWTAAVSASQQLADEFAAWLVRPDIGVVRGLRGGVVSRCLRGSGASGNWLLEPFYWQVQLNCLGQVDHRLHNAEVVLRNFNLT